MRTSPALPWSADTERGTIRLNKYVSQQDLLDGVLKWSVSDYHGTDVQGTIARTSGDKLVLQDGNGQLMYEFANFDYQTNVLELTRLQGSSESLVGVEFPAVIAPQGDVQVFKDRFGYELATGTLSKVYVRINKPWVGDDSGWGLGGPDYEFAAFTAVSPTNGSGTYGFSLWVDWVPAERSTPYEAGQMVEVSYGAGGSLNLDEYETDFEKPLYIEGLELSDSYETLKPDGSVAGSGEVGAIIGGLIGDDEVKQCFFTQDGIHAIGGVVNGEYTILLSNGTYQTNSVLNIAEKPVAAEIGIKVKILKSGCLQTLYSNNKNQRPFIYMLNETTDDASIGDAAPIQIINL